MYEEQQDPSFGELTFDVLHFYRLIFQSISPGIVETDFFHAATFLENDAKIGDVFPALRGEDISNAIVFLLTTDYHVNITEITVRPVGEPF